MIDSTIVATAAASFALGWAIKGSSRFIPSFRARSLQNNLKFVVVVRDDLNMSKGKLAAQCCHAAVACYKKALQVCPDVIKQWESQGQTKVVLKSNKGELGMKQLASEAADLGLPSSVIRDAGRTQVPSGTLTVVGIGPGCADKIDKLTVSFKLC